MIFRIKLFTLRVKSISRYFARSKLFKQSLKKIEISGRPKGEKFAQYHAEQSSASFSTSVENPAACSGWDFEAKPQIMPLKRQAFGRSPKSCRAKPGKLFEPSSKKLRANEVREQMRKF